MNCSICGSPHFGPSEQSTHAPGDTLMLVAYVEEIYGLMGATARQIPATCPPLNVYEDDETFELLTRHSQFAIAARKGALRRAPLFR